MFDVEMASDWSLPSSFNINVAQKSDEIPCKWGHASEVE